MGIASVKDRLCEKLLGWFCHENEQMPYNAPSNTILAEGRNQEKR